MKYPLKVMEILLKSFFCPSVGRFIGYVRVFLVARAAVILGAMSLPVTEAHPAEIVLAPVTLHVVASAILLYTNLALGTDL